MRENDEAIEKLDAAATLAIALIKDTSGPDVQSLLTNAAIGNDLAPIKTVSIFKLAADRRYTGKAFDIKEQIMERLRNIGFAVTIEEVSMLTNQLTNVMKKATKLLTKPNPEFNPVVLLAARASHAAQQAMIIARNVLLTPDLQLPALEAFVEPIAAVAVDLNSTLPTSQEVLTIMLDRIDSGNPELRTFRTICEADILRSESYQQTMATITELISTTRPSMNQRSDRVLAHRAASAAVSQDSMASHQFAQYDDEEQSLYDEEYESLGSGSASASAVSTTQSKRPRYEDQPPAQCFFYNGTTGECDRERQTGSCPFHKGHYGNKPARSVYNPHYNANGPRVGIPLPVGRAMMPPQETMAGNIARLERDLAQARAVEAAAKQRQGASLPCNASAVRDDTLQG